MIIKSDFRKTIFDILHKEGLHFSNVILSDDPITMIINLATYTLTIGVSFAEKWIRDEKDIVFLINHEIFHRYIANQWNKMKFVNAIHRYNIFHEIDWGIINFVEDSFINPYIRNSDTAMSDFPEYYYTKGYKLKNPRGLDFCLCNKGKFSKSKTRFSTRIKNKTLKSIRDNKEFLIDLSIMAQFYWIIWEEKQNDKDKSITKNPLIITIDDPLGDGVPITYSTKDEQRIVDFQKKEIEVFGQEAAKGRRERRKYVPDYEKDIKFSKFFTIKSKFMEKVGYVDNKCLSTTITSILETARKFKPEYYDSISIPSSLSRHDRIMSVGLDQDPLFWQHRLPDPEEENKKVKWDLYIDVSGSMGEEIALCRFIAKRLKDEGLINKMYVFSDTVHPYDGGNWLYTTSGTAMVKPIEQAVKNGVEHIMFIGDGADGRGDSCTYHWNYMNEATKVFMKKAETFFILVTAHSKDKSIMNVLKKWTSSVFKTVYVFQENSIIKGGKL